MNRRGFLVAATALAIAPAARASDMLDYSDGLIEQALAEGKTVFVDYSADWCSTCLRQERVVEALRSENPKYDEAMIFVRVDWDRFKSHKVATARKIPRRSTLILLRGDQELGRIVAGTSQDVIKELMDKGLKSGA
ncbi:MAG: thioredoxin family protein [Kiloniellales bacterium]|nr:thioredoxin family protein [Kiloniellales bacterium]